MTMQLGWNLGYLNYYTPMWPCVNVAKYAQPLQFQRAGQTQFMPVDTDEAATAAWSTATNTWNIVNAEKGSVYGLSDSYTVVTVDADHDLTAATYTATVQIAGNTGGIADGYYALYSVIDFRTFAVTASISGSTGAVGTVQCAPVNYRWSPYALAVRSIGTHYPSGTYDFYNGANVTFTFGDSGGSLNLAATSWGTKTVVPSDSGLSISTTGNWASGGSFKAIMPGYKAAYEAGTTFWHPTFTSLLSMHNSTVIRHMDSVRTNNSNVRTWAQRCPQTAWNSLAGRTINRPIKITASTYGVSSTYFGSSTTLTITAEAHGLTTGDYLLIRGANGTPSRNAYPYIVEVVDVDTLRIKLLNAQTAEMTWGWADANVYTGPSYEDLIDLHNTLGLDVWVCIPHLADDDYVTQMATLFATTLDASLKVYVEWSNETWQVYTNSFLQGHYCECQARGDGTYNNQNKWAGKRARECFALWDAAWSAALGGADARLRVYRVAAVRLSLASDISDYLFGLTTGGQVKADVMAVALYYHNQSSYSDLATLKTQCLSYITTTLDPWMTAAKAIADAATTDHGTGMPIVAYEGGTDVTDNNATAQSFLTSTERYDCDLALFEYAAAEGITLWCHYQFMYEQGVSSGKYYQWGALSYMDDVSDSVYRPTWAAIGEYFGTPVGFHSPFPWLIGMMGGTTSPVYPPWKVDDATWFAPGAVESNTFHPGAVEHNVISS